VLAVVYFFGSVGVLGKYTGMRESVPRHVLSERRQEGRERKVRVSDGRIRRSSSKLLEQHNSADQYVTVRRSAVRHRGVRVQCHVHPNVQVDGAKDS
jgi:hypothetical protein